MDEAFSPRLFAEPPIPETTEFRDVEHVRSVIRQLDLGSFRMPALLAERMLWNPRLRAVVSTRLGGLIATTIRWKPSRNNKDARRAARDIVTDWPLMMPAPMRKQMLKWALFLGVGFAQRALDTAPGSGRSLYRMRPYWPGFASWYWSRGCYRIQTFNRGVTETPTPSLDPSQVVERDASPPLGGAPVPPGQSPWVIAEPFGVNSWREALMHAAWRPWIGHEWASRDQARASEKNGVGAIKAKYPQGKSDEHKAAVQKFAKGLRTIGSEGVFPLEQRGDGQPSFDAEPFEYNGTGFQAISDTLGANAVALAILFLGHNLTTEIKNGGSYAAAGIADYIRDDVKYDDAAAEQAYAQPQIVQPWALANYGDPGLAPIAEPETDSPTVNLRRAQMIFYVGQACAQLRANVPRVDLDRLAEEFDLPMLAEGTIVQVPGGGSSGGSEDDAGTNEPSSPAAPAAPDQAAAIAILEERVAELERRAA